MFKVFEGWAALHFFLGLVGYTILIKCLDNFYPNQQYYQDSLKGGGGGGGGGGA